MMTPSCENPSDAPATPPTPVEAQPAQGPASQKSDGGCTATAARPRANRPKPSHLPPFRVLLHNDDVNPADFVVDTLIELTPLNRQGAVNVMLEADSTGVSLVLVTHRERAELYHEQLTSKKLTVTIEPAT